MVVTAASGGPFVAASIFVFSVMEQLRTALKEQARIDALTCLPNRRSFLKTLHERLGAGELGYLLIIDADHFKVINDTYGHAVGDAALKAIAERLKSTCRGKDNAGRIGGEEFGIFLGRSTEREADIFASKLLKPIELHVDECPEALSITLSIGVAKTRSKERVSAFMHRADQALYLAKNMGRARMMHWEHQIKTLIPNDTVPPRRRSV
jgi:diguanylate cyclase (GGDEF)-like protein